MKKEAKFFIIITISIIIFIGIIIYLLIKSPEETTKQESIRKNLPFEFFEDKPQFLTPEQLDQIIKEKGMSDEALQEIYKDYYKYPHFSRPLNKNMVDLINPWFVEAQPLPVILNPVLKNEKSLQEYIEKLKQEGKSEEEIRELIEEEFKNYPLFVFQLNRHTLTYGDTIIGTLKITDNKGNILSYDIIEASIYSDPHFGNIRIATPEFNDAGISPDEKEDQIYTFSWKIPSQDKKYWGDLSLKVKVRLENTGKEIELERGFYSSPFVIAEFLDQFDEELKDGHLIITAYLDVKKECEYHIQANLFSVEFDEPSHWVTYKKILKAGIHKIPFTFWGKIFRDKGLEGHFVLKDLRGYCENLPFPASWFDDPSKVDQIVNAKPKEEPLFFYIPYTNLTYKTKRYYKLNDFSDEEWDSEEKREKLGSL
ncbi:MAG: hypothetical protein KatS3mg129_2117 [Leptospiraceae bacterium]|nr:MAG: hypothetical protein KatS3mg129_2117 [Leptospiraceae bacterium]